MTVPRLPAFTTGTLIFMLLATAAMGAQPIVVNGQNDIAVDRQAIQDAIDGASDGDTVRLRGTFQIDGQRIFIEQSIRLRGEAIDNDGDGATNEDWTDGVDNDGDGAIDEDDWDTFLLGLTDANGLPRGDLPDGSQFNRGIAIEGLEDEVEDLEIRDIAFINFHRAITALPDIQFGDTFACSDVIETGGSVEELTVRKNRFFNNARAVQFFGGVDEGEIKDNVVVGGGAAQLLLIGGVTGCTGPGDPPAIGNPTETRVKGNLVQVLGNAGLITSETVDTEVKGNTFVGGSFAVSFNDDVGADLVDNQVRGAVFALVTFQAVGPAKVAGNVIEGHFIGVLLDASSGYLITNNAFSDRIPFFVADVQLEATSTNNRVVVSAGDTVNDLGVGNTVIVENP